MSYQSVIEDLEKFDEIDRLLQETLGSELRDVTTIVEAIQILCDVVKSLPLQKSLIEEATPDYIKEFMND